MALTIFGGILQIVLMKCSCTLKGSYVQLESRGRIDGRFNQIRGDVISGEVRKLGKHVNQKDSQAE